MPFKVMNWRMPRIRLHLVDLFFGCCECLQVWLVLELCNGGTLKDAVSMGKLKVSNRLEVVSMLCGSQSMVIA